MEGRRVREALGRDSGWEGRYENLCSYIKISNNKQNIYAKNSFSYRQGNGNTV